MSKEKHKVYTVSGGNLMFINIFKILFHNATMKQLAKHKEKRVILCTYNETSIAPTRGTQHNNRTQK